MKKNIVKIITSATAVAIAATAAIPFASAARKSILLIKLIALC